jgi:hypothetical protein
VYDLKEEVKVNKYRASVTVDILGGSKSLTVNEKAKAKERLK